MIACIYSQLCVFFKRELDHVRQLFPATHYYSTEAGTCEFFYAS